MKGHHMASKWFSSPSFLLILMINLMMIQLLDCQSNDINSEANVLKGDESVEKVMEQYNYSKGSICAYCIYCKFCRLCDRDCPCEVGPKKENCHMCKYCSYCFLCSSLCDKFCQPGSVVDVLSAAFLKGLPLIHSEEVDADIKSVEDWLDYNE